jgi:hypothetical protein
MKKSTSLLVTALALIFCATVSFAVWRTLSSRDSSRGELLGALLRDMPRNTGGVLYVDLAQLRQSTFTEKLFAWAPKPQADADYTRFVQDTGFDYERDLDRLAFAAAKSGSQSWWFVIADGSFDQKKFAAYLAKVGTVEKRAGRDIYSIPTSLSAPASRVAGRANSPILLTFLSASRLAATNDADLSLYLDQKISAADPAQWRTRFARLAGSPVFVVVRQNGDTASALAAQTPGGFQSPQLSALLAQLSWLTLAAQPENDSLRIVAEGETPSDAVAGQLSDMLNGVVILAQTGLNSAKTTEQLDPQMRAAYLELLKSADITRLDREDLKAVRVVFEVTQSFLTAAAAPKPTAPAPAATPQPTAEPRTKPSARKR